MRIVKCDTGHYYDADAYNECPHCNGKAEYRDTVTSPVKKKCEFHNEPADNGQKDQPTDSWCGF